MSGARLCFNHGKSRSQVGHEKRLGFRRIWATCLRDDPASECVLRKVRKEGFLIENLKIHGVWKSSTACSSKNGTAPPFAVHREPRQNQFSMFQQDERFPEGRSVDTLRAAGYGRRVERSRPGSSPSCARWRGFRAPN